MSDVFTAFGIGAIISGTAVVWIKNELEKSSENKRKLRELKEQQYKEFLNDLMGFYKGWENKDQQKKFIREVNTNAIISASDEVYRLARDYIDSFDEKVSAGEDERQKIYAKLVLAMRNELNSMLGNPPTTLAENEIKVMQLND